MGTPKLQLWLKGSDALAKVSCKHVFTFFLRRQTLQLPSPQPLLFFLRSQCAAEMHIFPFQALSTSSSLTS